MKKEKEIKIPMPSYEIEVMEFKVSRLKNLIDLLVRRKRKASTDRKADVVKLRVWKVFPSGEKEKMKDVWLMEGDAITLERGRNIFVEF